MNAEQTPGPQPFAIDLPGGGLMRCEVDDYTDPWAAPDVVIMLHGIAEEGRIWRPWAPHFARRFRVIRPDLRGFGQSSPLPAGKPFRIADWAEDIAHLVATFGNPRTHIVATKLGALVAFELAQRQPAWLASLTLAGMLPSPSGSLGPWIGEWVSTVEREGVIGWARATMPGRMGEYLSPAAYQWWIDLMGRAPAPTVLNCFRLLPDIHGPSNPERVRCPTLFLLAGAQGSTAEVYNQRPAGDAIRAVAARVPHSECVEVDAGSYHIAATHPDLCAQAVLPFLERAAEAKAAGGPRA